MPRPRGLVQQIDQGLHRQLEGGGLPRGVRLLVAVSGGADSVALLRLLVEINRSDYWGWNLVVGHVDHGLRGAALRGDARFVAALARNWACPARGGGLALRAGSSEDAARQGVAALAAMCRAKKCVGVVMAHHADDQAETVLMRVFRGTGIEGLAGMVPRSQISGMTIFRPLLQVRGAALRLSGANASNLCEDESNATGEFLPQPSARAVMPLIELLRPCAVEALGRLAVLAAESQDLVQTARPALDG